MLQLFFNARGNARRKNQLEPLSFRPAADFHRLPRDKKGMEKFMTNHRRWIALLLCAVVTVSSVSVLADNTPDVQDPLFSLTATEQPVTQQAETEAEEQQEGALQAGVVGEADAAPAAEEPQEEIVDPNSIRITLNGVSLALDVAPTLYDGIAYVPLRSFAEQMGCTVSWSGSSAVVTKGQELQMTISNNSELVRANDRFFYMQAKPVNLNGNLMVPVRGLSKVFSLEISWNADAKTVGLTGGTILAWADDYYNEKDLLWLSRIIHAESQGESLEGKIAVGNVILNRTEASQFPNTIYDVIFDKKYGTQFTPVKTGRINNTPNADSVLAAKLCLEGYEVIEEGLYFLNISKATSNWITKNREFVTKIGSHSFFA